MPEDRSEIDGFATQDGLEHLLPERTTEEIIADMAAGDPAKHGKQIEQRMRSVIAVSRRALIGDDSQQVYEARVLEIGGDPEATVGLNKPRYTMDEEGNVKDHETGQIHSKGGERAVDDAGETEAGGEAGARNGSGDGSQVSKEGGRGQGDQGSDGVGVLASDYGAPCDTLTGPCEHSWPDTEEAPLTAETPCSVCGLMFGQWAAS